MSSSIDPWVLFTFILVVCPSVDDRMIISVFSRLLNVTGYTLGFLVAIRMFDRPAVSDSEDYQERDFVSFSEIMHLAGSNPKNSSNLSWPGGEGAARCFGEW